MTRADGSAGDADYGVIGSGYRQYRRPEPEFERAIVAALGDARRVVNVGAGAGSYEPDNREVTAVEPSATMRAQRRAHQAPAIDASAESLPFADGSFDAALSTFSIHQWQNLEAGLCEMRRVSRGPVVIMTCDPVQVEKFWLRDYAPEVIETEARRYPSLERIQACLGGTVEIETLPIPLACADGFAEAYFGRPEMFLDPGARKANSAWSFVSQDSALRSVESLRRSLDNGRWDEEHGGLRACSHFEGSLVLIRVED
ncbi:class I SAM-dependent methyltransferase [Brevibacterium picturae]|uniref:Methyltransferase domain-containing protein n=1 Tax=Brevibacterium picturae TaxID=260553 RepID=A0ABN2BFL2_9MICO